MSCEDPYLRLFCSRCQAVIPLPDSESVIVCRVCKKDIDASVYDGLEFCSTKVYNSLESKEQAHASRKNQGGASAAPEGPIVERKCTRCGHELMSYTTLQLRSADEGQTVFFTCLKCRHKDIENS